MIKETKMTKGVNFENRKNYVERELQAALMPVQDFNGIRYARTSNVDQEYIRVESLLGTCAYLDITAVPKEQILRDVTQMLCFGGLPASVITDTVKLRQVAMLFI